MRNAGVITGLCVATLSAGCSEPRSLTSPTSVNPAPVSLATTPSGAAATGDPVLPSRVDAAVPFKGRLEGEYGVASGEFPIFHESISGSGNATHLGRFTLAIQETVNFLNATATGTFIFTAANGDIVSGSFTGKAQPGPLVSILEEATVTGGTGRFVGATGRFIIDRVFDPVNRTTSGSFDGALSSTGTSSH